MQGSPSVDLAAGPSPADFQALREVEVEWLIDALGGSIANLAYPVGCGDAPMPDHLARAANMLFDRYAKMIEMARRAGQAERDELLNALKHCVIERSEWLPDARAAIAKATGAA